MDKWDVVLEIAAQVPSQQPCLHVRHQADRDLLLQHPMLDFNKVALRFTQQDGSEPRIGRSVDQGIGVFFTISANEKLFFGHREIILDCLDAQPCKIGDKLAEFSRRREAKLQIYFM